MNKIRDFYYKYGSFVGIAIGVFIIIVSQNLLESGVEKTTYTDRLGRTMPFYTSGGLWLGLVIILLSIKKQWLISVYNLIFKGKKETKI